MQESSVNLPPLGASLELISCATGLKFEYAAVTIYMCNPFDFDLMTIQWSGLSGVEQFNSKKGNNFGCKLPITTLICRFAHYLASKNAF